MHARWPEGRWTRTRTATPKGCTAWLCLNAVVFEHPRRDQHTVCTPRHPAARKPSDCAATRPGGGLHRVTPTDPKVAWRSRRPEGRWMRRVGTRRNLGADGGAQAQHTRRPLSTSRHDTPRVASTAHRQARRSAGHDCASPRGLAEVASVHPKVVGREHIDAPRGGLHRVASHPGPKAWSSARAASKGISHGGWSPKAADCKRRRSSTTRFAVTRAHSFAPRFRST